MDRYGIHIDPDAPVGSLPVAEQQMAEILKILVRDPELIILDEPTSAAVSDYPQSDCGWQDDYFHFPPFGGIV